MAGTCYATFKPRGSQPRPAEARSLARLVHGLRRLRFSANNCTIIYPRSGQPGATPGEGLQPAVAPSLAPGDII